MEYTQITSLVPEGEHFDQSAINEGVWLSQNHLNSIEQHLQSNATAIAAHASEVENLNGQITAVNTEHDKARQELATANTTVSSRDTRIQELETEVATLKKTPGEDLQNTSREKDEQGGGATDPKAKYRTSFDVEAEKYSRSKK